MSIRRQSPTHRATTACPAAVRQSKPSITTFRSCGEGLSHLAPAMSESMHVKSRLSMQITCSVCIPLHLTYLCSRTLVAKLRRGPTRHDGQTVTVCHRYHLPKVLISPRAPPKPHPPPSVVSLSRIRDPRTRIMEAVHRRKATRYRRPLSKR